MKKKGTKKKGGKKESNTFKMYAVCIGGRIAEDYVDGQDRPLIFYSKKEAQDFVLEPGEKAKRITIIL